MIYLARQGTDIALQLQHGQRAAEHRCIQPGGIDQFIQRMVALAELYADLPLFWGQLRYRPGFLFGCLGQILPAHILQQIIG